MAHNDEMSVRKPRNQTCQLTLMRAILVEALFPVLAAQPLVMHTAESVREWA